MSPSLDRVVFCSRFLVGSSAKLPSLPNSFLQECSTCGLCAPSSCNGTLIASGMLVGGIDSKADWLQGLIATLAEEVLFRVPTHRAGLTSAGLWYLLSPNLVEVVGWCSGMI